MPTTSKPTGTTRTPPRAADLPPEDEPGEYEERPFAVGVPGERSAEPDAQTPWGFPAEPGTGEPPETPGAEERPVIERPERELLLAAACVLLAGSVFLPWYKTLFQRSQSGWASGTWGPVIFFLALAGIAIVVLRRLKVPIAFPFDHSIVLEGIGWVSVLFAFLKRFITPRVGNFHFSTSWGLIVAMFAAVAVALVGGTVSSGAPFVARPGWFNDRAGKTGAAVLSLAIVLGALFGVTNGGSSTSTAAKSPTGQTPTFTKGMPKCGKDAKFPTPAGLTAAQGQDASKVSPYCIIFFSSTLPANRTLGAFETALKAAKWKFAVLHSAGSLALTLTSPQCGSLSVTAPATSPSPKGSKAAPVKVSATAFFSKCPPAPKKT